MNKNYLTIDIGTGTTKLSLFRDDGYLYDFVSIKNKYYSDSKYRDATYFLPTEMKDMIFQGIDHILNKNPEIKVDAISSAGARQSIILIDIEGKEVIGLPNIDNRGKEFLDKIKEQEDIYKLTGKWVTEDFPAAKILGYKSLYEKEYEKCKTFTSISEWIGYVFTGILSIEPSQSGETQLYDIHNNTFTEKLANKYGIESLDFPEIINSGENLGKVKKSWIEKYPQFKDAVFVVGGADTQIALIGKNLSQGSLAIVSGTTSPIVSISTSPIFDKEERLWVDSNLRGENYLLEVNPGSTGLNYQRFKDGFLTDYTYEELEKEYEKIDCVRVTCSFTSLRFTEKLSQKRGGFFTKAPLPTDITSIEFGWAILGDIACSIYEQLLVLENITKEYYQKIIGVGFGFSSNTLCQMISDLTKKIIILPYNFQNATSCGLVYLCNEYFKIKNKNVSLEKTYYPQKNSLILDYYDKWKIDRGQII